MIINIYLPGNNNGKYTMNKGNLIFLMDEMQKYKKHRKEFDY